MSDPLFHQILAPIAGNLPLSFFVGMLPVGTVLVLLGVLRRPAWQASMAGLIVGLLVAIIGWRFPVKLAFSSALEGTAFALWPILWIPFNALLLYNITVSSGRFDGLRRWLLSSLPDDRRVVLVVIGFCFGALLEGVAGSGTPVAICSALLIAVGWKPIDAVVITLIFDTAPVAFGALGLPVTVLGMVTHLPTDALAAMMGRQLPILAFLLPTYVMFIYGGRRSVRALWPLLVVAGGSFAITQFLAANFINYGVVDVLSSVASLIVTVMFLRVWRPKYDPEFAIVSKEPGRQADAPSAFNVWLPWVLLSVIVTAWTLSDISRIGEIDVLWPVLHNAVFITIYKQIYTAVWSFQPLSTGTAVLATAIATAVCTRVSPREFIRAIGRTWVQIRYTVPTVIFILSLAYLMNYSGIAYSLGLGVASIGMAFPVGSAFLGWMAVFLTGSDTSGNALFGNLQVVAARQLGLDPILFAATNSSGGVMGKMISPQNLSIGVSTTELRGKEGLVFARTFPHSLVLTLLITGVTLFFQFVTPGLIPH